MEDSDQLIKQVHAMSSEKRKKIIEANFPELFNSKLENKLMAEQIRAIIREELESFRSDIISVINSSEQLDSGKPMSVEEACAYLGIAEQTLYSRVSSGTVPYHKRGKLYFFKNELEEFVRGTWKPNQTK